jgi:hypothetical protein
MSDMLRDAARWGSVPGAFDELAAKNGAIAIGAGDAWDQEELREGEAYIADTPRQPCRYRTIWLSGDRRARAVGGDAGKLLAEHHDLQRTVQAAWRTEAHPTIIDDLGLLVLPAPHPFTVEAVADILTDASEEVWGHGTLHVPLPLSEELTKKLVRTLDGKLYANICLTPLTQNGGRTPVITSTPAVHIADPPDARRVVSRRDDGRQEISRRETSRHIDDVS